MAGGVVDVHSLHINSIHKRVLSSRLSLTQTRSACCHSDLQCLTFRFADMNLIPSSMPSFLVSQVKSIRWIPDYKIVNPCPLQPGLQQRKVLTALHFYLHVHLGDTETMHCALWDRCSHYNLKLTYSLKTMQTWARRLWETRNFRNSKIVF
jgi:hypothetical protein